MRPYSFPAWAEIGKFVNFEDSQWVIEDRYTVFKDGREWGVVSLGSTDYQNVGVDVLCNAIHKQPKPTKGLQA